MKRDRQDFALIAANASCNRVAVRPHEIKLDALSAVEYTSWLQLNLAPAKNFFGHSILRKPEDKAGFRDSFKRRGRGDLRCCTRTVVRARRDLFLAQMSCTSPFWNCSNRGAGTFDSHRFPVPWLESFHIKRDNYANSSTLQTCSRLCQGSVASGLSSVHQKL